MTNSNNGAVADRADLEYGDVLLRLWAADLAAEVNVFEGHAVINIPIPTTDGFFFLGGWHPEAGQTFMPDDRGDLRGWHLVFYPPNDDDPDGALDTGADIFATSVPDVDAMLAVVIPTVTNIITVLTR